MPSNIQIKQHPDIQTENTVPDVLPSEVFIIGYKTSLFIDGKYVLKFKVSMLIRKDGETDPTYIYSRYMRFGFLSTKTKADFYGVSNHCYQTAIIEFNKSLDVVFGRGRFMDTGFISLDELKEMVDNSLSPRLN
jgi:hypothetical protein